MENKSTGEIFFLEGTEVKDFALDTGGEIKVIDGEKVYVRTVPAENFQRIKRMALRQRELKARTAKNRERTKMAKDSRKDQR